MTPVTYIMVWYFAYNISFQQVLGASVSSPCSNPCGGSNAVAGTQDQSFGTSLNFTTAVEHLWTSNAEVKTQADQLVRSYNNASSAQIRITDSLASLLRESHIVPHTRANSTNVTEALQNDFNDVTRIAIFVAHIHKRERDSNAIVKYSHLMDDLEGFLDATLCKIKGASQVRGDILSCTVTSHPMLATYIGIRSTSTRYVWDYIVFKDTVDFFATFINVYNTYESNE